MTIRYPPKTPAYKLAFNEGRDAVYWYTFDPALPGFRDLTGKRPPINAEWLAEGEVRIERVVPLREAFQQLAAADYPDEVGR